MRFGMASGFVGMRVGQLKVHKQWVQTRKHHSTDWNCCRTIQVQDSKNSWTGIRELNRNDLAA
jgi:hypothetical protein